MRLFSFLFKQLSPAEKEELKSGRRYGLRHMLFVLGSMLLVFFVFMFMTFIIKPLAEEKHALKELENLKKEEAAAKKRLQNVRDQYNAVESDAQFNETLSRDSGTAKPGEVIIEFPDKPEQPTPPPTVEETDL